MRKGSIRAIQAGGIVFLLVALLGFTGFVGVDPGIEKAVVEKGELQGCKDDGWYWLNPATTDTHKVSTRPQIYVQSGNAGEGEEADQDDSIESKTIDGNVVFADVAIRYRVTNCERFYLEWYDSKAWPFGKFETEKIRSPSRDLVRDIIGTVNSNTVYTGEAQQMVEERLEDEISTELENSGADLIDVDVRNIRFSKDYQDILEEKASSEQQREIQRNLANADADAKIIRAEADKNASIIRAEGNREADKIRKEELSQEIITIRQIEAYNNANTVYVPVGQDGLPIYLQEGSGNTTSD